MCEQSTLTSFAIELIDGMPFAVVILHRRPHVDYPRVDLDRIGRRCQNDDLAGAAESNDPSEGITKCDVSSGRAWPGDVDLNWGVELLLAIEAL